jgi:hypothetical protein
MCLQYNFFLLSLSFFFGAWGVSLGLHTCEADSLSLEPHLQSILLWLFWRWGGSQKIFAQAGLEP